MRRRLGYRDAVVVLGGDPQALSALDRALAAALSLATGGLSGTVLGALNADGRVIRMGRDLVVALGARLRGAKGVDRAQRLEAAHTAIVVAAFFDALETSALPLRRQDLRLSRDRQVRLSGGGVPGRDLVEMLLTVAPPRPAAFLPYEHCLGALETWYGELSARMLSFTEELAIWDGVDSEARAEAGRYFGAGLSGDAVARYQELYARLAVEIAEFGFWAGQVDQQATRSEVRRCLAAIEPLLLSLSPGPEPAHVALALSNAYRAVLSRPILAEGQTPAGIRLPTLEESYLDPDFRVSAVQAGELTSDESWWAEVPVRSDLTEYLADALTSTEATAAPLVVLGQPGAGKSALTKVLAARLPPKGFLPVRVVLREVPADAEVQDQIEHAVRAATGLRSDWPDIARAAGQAIPVVLLDGFDELLQATGVSQSDYLIRLARFQQREADQGRPVIAIVTSRTAVADRVRYPPGTMALRLEPFRDEQIETWLRTWNACNAQLFTERSLRPLTAEALARHRVLASEPLLLLMLALYDADANALQLGTEAADASMDETVLYEKLLTAFAVREVEKSAEGVPVGELPVLVEQELQRLSLIAFSIMNRRRQWVTAAELDADLAALLGQTVGQHAGFRTPLTPGGDRSRPVLLHPAGAGDGGGIAPADVRVPPRDLRGVPCRPADSPVGGRAAETPLPPHVRRSRGRRRPALRAAVLRTAVIAAGTQVRYQHLRPPGAPCRPPGTGRPAHRRLRRKREQDRAPLQRVPSQPARYLVKARRVQRQPGSPHARASAGAFRGPPLPRLGSPQRPAGHVAPARAPLALGHDRARMDRPGTGTLHQAPLAWRQP